MIAIHEIPESNDLGSARASRAVSGASPEANLSSNKNGDGEAPSPAREARALPGDNVPGGEVRYNKRRRLPHFERPWSKFAVAFSTLRRNELIPAERDIVLESIVREHVRGRYELYVACVMPDHVHVLFEPQVKDLGGEGESIFWSLAEIFQGIKSASAHKIAKARGKRGRVWQEEYFDRLIRSESDLQEKFLYICRNPWDSGIVGSTEDYPWLWTPERLFGDDSVMSGRAGAPPAVSGASPETNLNINKHGEGEARALPGQGSRPEEVH
jgi:REP element-mobilizing transposase RayT